jgi:hypothetical protein
VCYSVIQEFSHHLGGTKHGHSLSLNLRAKTKRRRESESVVLVLVVAPQRNEKSYMVQEQFRPCSAGVHHHMPVYETLGLFSCEKGLGSATVALFVLFGNLCSIMD